jgi:O-methyltransferase
MKDTAISLVRTALRQTGFRLVRDDGCRRRIEELIRELTGWHDLAEPPGIGETPLRVELLAEMEAASVSEGLYLIRHLHRARAVPGDVCVFGVGDGSTAALLANELRDGERHLWLYDSFEGPGRPTGEDVLLDDVLGLGAVERYEHAFAHRIREVRGRLDQVGFPPERTHLVAGHLDEEVTAMRLPERACLAFLDGNLYEPTRVALDLLHGHLPTGAIVVVDGYGYFTAGAKTAVDRFSEKHGGEYELRFPHRFAGHFALLCRAG